MFNQALGGFLDRSHHLLDLFIRHEWMGCNWFPAHSNLLDESVQKSFRKITSVVTHHNLGCSIGVKNFILHKNNDDSGRQIQGSAKDWTVRQVLDTN